MPFIEERTYYPTGCDPDDYSARPFAVRVQWRGRGRWLVERGGDQLSRSGRWLWVPSKMNQMRWCRYTFEEACERAEAVVDSMTVNGRTWAQWQEAR